MVPFYYWPTHYYNLPALEIFSEPQELANMGKEAVSGWEKETKAHPFGWETSQSNSYRLIVLCPQPSQGSGWKAGQHCKKTLRQQEVIVTPGSHSWIHRCEPWLLLLTPGDVAWVLGCCSKREELAKCNGNKWIVMGMEKKFEQLPIQKNES